LPQDPRRWLPGAPITLDIAAQLPGTVVPGAYQAFLALPDPEPRLRSRLDYAIRLANSGAWRPSTGDNALKWRIEVRPARAATSPARP